jgi:hypothetical protein
MERPAADNIEPVARPRRFLSTDGAAPLSLLVGFSGVSHQTASAVAAVPKKTSSGVEQFVSSSVC